MTSSSVRCVCDVARCYQKRQGRCFYSHFGDACTLFPLCFLVPPLVVIKTLLQTPFVMHSRHDAPEAEVTGLLAKGYEDALLSIEKLIEEHRENSEASRLKELVPSVGETRRGNLSCSCSYCGPTLAPCTVLTARCRFVLDQVTASRCFPAV